MSKHNMKGAPFAILNEQGYFDLYDPKGGKMEFPKSMIRITQTPNDIDKAVVVFPVNVIRSMEEMTGVINSNHKS